MTTSRRLMREGALWLGGTLGALSLLMLLAGWALNVTPLVFASGSMSPAYDVGSLGVAREAAAADLRTGDVVSVVDEHGVRVTHRIVAVDHHGDRAVLTLQGDTNNVPDAQAYVVESAPRVALGVPYAGYVLNTAASPYGVAVAAAAVTGLLFLAFGTPSGGAAGSTARRRTRTLIPVGVVSMLLVGGAAGAGGAAPWAFTSAYWTDSATATTTASAANGDTTPPVLTNPLPADNASATTWTGLDCANSGAGLEQMCVTATDTGGSGVSSVTVKLVRTSGTQQCWNGTAFVAGTGCSAQTMTVLSGSQYRTSGLTSALMVAGTYSATYTATDVSGNVATLGTTFRVGANVPAFSSPCSNPTGNNLTISWTYGTNPTTGFELRTNKVGGSTVVLGPTVRSYTGNFQNYDAEIWIVANNGGVYSGESAHYYVSGTGSTKTCTLVP